MERAIRTTCPYCGVGCGVIASLNADGQVTVRGDEQHPANVGRLCVKGAALGETVGLAGRLLFPEVDGERATWTQALAAAGSRLREVIDRHGPQAVAFYASGQLLTEDYYAANKLMKGFIGAANIDTNSRLCMSSAVTGYKRALGADVVMQSATKYLDGQGRVIAGALCASNELIHKKILPVQRSMGITLSPFNAWVVLKGLETLNLRMKAHSEQALELAQWLESHPAVDRVFYPGLASHPQHDLAMRQQSGLGGAVLSFDVRATSPEEGRVRAFHVIDSTQVCSITANLGDTKTTITHPASTSHGRLTEAQRQAAGLGQGLIRIAVGLEHIDDLKADLARGLDTLP